MNPEFSILVVDDDSMLGNMLREAFVMSGYACTTALDGAAALEIVKTEKFDFMITDVMMPGMNGFELTERVKKQYPAMEVIMMTGFSQEDSFQKALASGAEDFITKPFKFEELIVRIERVRESARTLEEMRKREHAIVDMSREIIANIQDEAKNVKKNLEQEIAKLGKTTHDSE